MKPELRVIQNSEGDAHIDYGATGCLVAPGEYRAKFSHYETATVFTTPKVFLHFQIIDPGEYFGVKLFRAYRVAAIDKPRPGESSHKNGKIKLKPRSELFLTLCRALELQVRPDRISLRALLGRVVRVKVRTVVRDYKGRPLPECLRYSTVDDILSVEA